MHKISPFVDYNKWLKQWPVKHIPNDDTQNYFLCRLKLVVKTLDTKLNEPTNQNSFKVLKVVKVNECVNVITKLGGLVQ